MDEKKKSELKGMFKGVLITLLLLSIFSAGAVYATTLMSDEGFFVDGNEVVVEKDYTTWTKVWNNSLPDGLWRVNDLGFLLDDRNDLLILTWYDGAVSGDHWNRFGIFNLADFSTVLLSPSGQHYTFEEPDNGYLGGTAYGNTGTYFGGTSRSIQTYFVLVRNDELTLEVYRSGSLLWSHNVSIEGYIDIGTIGISSTGKWILIGGRTTGFYPYTPKISCYEGS